MPGLHPGIDDVLERFLVRLSQVIDECRRAATRSPKFELKPVDEEREAEYQAFYTKVQGHMMSRTILLSNEHECVGIGPDFTEPGDLICILLGCDAPVLLWKKGEEGKYMFVGEADVLGFMDGQGMDGLQAGKYTLVDFDLV